jgi:hypothetical protein
MYEKRILTHLRSIFFRERPIYDNLSLAFSGSMLERRQKTNHGDTMTPRKAEELSADYTDGHRL